MIISLFLFSSNSSICEEFSLLILSNLLLSKNNLKILKISYATIANAGNRIASNQPLFEAKKYCALPKPGNLNNTFPTILFGNTFSSSATSLASPLL